jgi:hypothetical protein
MIRETLVIKSLNVAAFSMWPGLSALLALFWWIWFGQRWCAELLKGEPH